MLQTLLYICSILPSVTHLKLYVLFKSKANHHAVHMRSMLVWSRARDIFLGNNKTVCLLVLPM